MVCNIVIQILRSNAAKAVQERFEALMIRIHILDVIDFFGHVALFARIDLLMRQLLLSGILTECWLFIGA